MYPNVRKVLETLLTSYEFFQALKESLSEPEKEQLKEIEEIAEEERLAFKEIREPKRQLADLIGNEDLKELGLPVGFLYALSPITSRNLISAEKFYNVLDRLDAYYKNREKPKRSQGK